MPHDAASYRGLSVTFLLASLLIAACSPEDIVLAPSGPGFAMRGMSFTSFRAGQYASADADLSLANLAATSANWMALLVTVYQDTAGSTVIRQDPFLTPTDDDLLLAIDRAHRRGLRVLLIPHVDISEEPDRSRSEIGTGFDDGAWAAWFASYRSFIEHYATLAQNARVDVLSVGTELTTTEARTTEWRALIQSTRSLYAGPLVYGSNWYPSPATVTWWDALDWIGVDAYFPLSSAAGPTAASLWEAWQSRGYVDLLRAISQRWNRPIILTEIGYRSIAGTANRPWCFSTDAPVNLEAQAAAYQAALAVFWSEPWVAGMFWWNWSPNPRRGGSRDTSYTPFGKPAAAILQSFYGYQGP